MEPESRSSAWLLAWTRLVRVRRLDGERGPRLERSAECRWVRRRLTGGASVIVGVATLVGMAAVAPPLAALPARARVSASGAAGGCGTAFVANYGSDSVSTIDEATRTKNPTDIPVGAGPSAVAITPDGKTAFVTNGGGTTVSTIDVATRARNPTDIPVGAAPSAIAITPDGKTAFVTNYASDSVSTIDVATRTKSGADIPVGRRPAGVAITPDGKTAFVTNFGSDSVSTIDVATRTRNPTDIPASTWPVGVAITPDGTTAFVANEFSRSVSTIDVATRTKNPTDIPVGTKSVGVAITPDGTTAFVTNDLADSVSTIDVATRGVSPTDIPVGSGPFGVAITPDGTTIFVANFGGTTVSTIDVATKHRTDITVGSNPFGVAIAPCTPLPSRISGTDAIATSIAVSQAAFPGSASSVVLARSDFFSDALAGGPLAAKVGGPLLITPGTPLTSSLDPRVLAEIQRVLPTGKTVYILGGPAALSPNIDTALTSAGYVVVRDQGANEFTTAVAVANQLGNPSTVFEATGLFFADALSAVPATIHTGGAILLTNGNVQAPETAAYLAAHTGDTRYAIGGPQAAFGADPSATPVFGADLYGTSAQVATTFLPNAAIYGAATGLNYPDALAGGLFMATGKRLGPVLLVNTNAPLPGPISGYLATLAIGTPGYVFGGPVAVGDDVLTALQAAVG